MALEADERLGVQTHVLREVSQVMKLTDRHMDVIIGVVIGLTIGLVYPLELNKTFFVVLSVIGLVRLAVK